MHDGFSAFAGADEEGPVVAFMTYQTKLLAVAAQSLVQLPEIVVQVAYSRRE